VSVIRMGNDMLRKLLAKKLITISDIPESPEKLADIAGIPLPKAREITGRAAYAR
jgi:hypothetical protein